MKVSLQWLKNYIDTDHEPKELGDILTTLGLEVEGMESTESIKGGLQGVVVGHVTSCRQHPNADRLSLTTVNVGQEEDIQVVCGAPNVAEGQKVLVATVGTTLYSSEGEPWSIKKGKIRGEVSEGMICAEDELGIGQSHDGIMVLDDHWQPGTAASEVHPVENDVVYDIGLTPNRSDATSHLGVAQDLAAYFRVNEGRTEDLRTPEVSMFKVDQQTLNIDVEVLNHKACPRYSGITISGIEVKESPAWLKNRLNSIDVRPINNIVDITNFVLHELGQPLHAFDADKISGNKIIVDVLPNDSKFRSLDEQERTLTDQDLMICDGDKKGMCIAGVFGGIDSGVTENTKNIFLESAHFNASWIRKTSTRHLLRTDAAKCFEKGSDPNITVYALERAANLIKELAGGMISSELIDIYPQEIKPVEIHLKYEKVNDMLGINLAPDKIHEILRAMNMEILPVDDQSIKVMVPTNKADVTRDVDLVEEILRVYGFNNIPVPTKVLSTINYTNYPNKNQIKNKVSDFLSNIGFNEMMNMSLIESKNYEGLDSYDPENFVFINNTSNIHLDIMRPEMLLSGLTAVQHNKNRQQHNLKLYELGKAYVKKADDYEETEFLTLFLTGNETVSWKPGSNSEMDFYDLKTEVHKILSLLGISKFQVEELDDSRFEFGLRYFRGPNELVRFGEVGEMSNRMGIKEVVYYAEFNVASLVAAVSKKQYVSEISKFPSSKRDLSVVVDEHVKFGELKAIAQKTDRKILKEVGLFDIYKNEEQLGKGKKSYAMNFLFENQERTLKDKEIEKIMTKMIQGFESQLGAVIRK